MPELLQRHDDQFVYVRHRRNAARVDHDRQIGPRAAAGCTCTRDQALQLRDA